MCGKWNDWAAGADVMHRDADGGFSVTVGLEARRAYRFRYLLDGQRWDNDWAADAYQPIDFGGDDSVVDLTALAEAVPPAAKKAPAKKAPPQTAREDAAAAAKPSRKKAKWRGRGGVGGQRRDRLLGIRAGHAPVARAGSWLNDGKRPRPRRRTPCGSPPAA